MELMNMNATKIGLFGIGLDKYWGQFAGLRHRLEGYQGRIRARMEQAGATIIDAGLVDSPDKSQAAGELFAREGVTMVFLYVSTYALSSTVLPVVQRARVPVVVLNLQPTAAIDYAWFNGLGDRGVMTGEWLANCQACSAPEIACVFNRAGIPYHLVTGTLDDAAAWREIDAWIAAARVAHALRHLRVGTLGHYYCGMLGVYSDMTQLAAAFGCHFEIVEMCEVRRWREASNEDQLQQKLKEFYETFAVSPSCSEY